MSSENKNTKEFALSSFSIKNRVSVYVLVFIVTLMGLVSYNTMPKESFPEIKQPTIYINTAYFGNSPSDIENLITRPIEKELKGISGIKKLKSTSIQDFSVIIAEFNLDIPASEALVDVKDAVDRAKQELPNDLDSDPNIFELDFSEFPVMNVNVSGPFEYKVLKEHTEYLQDEIENLAEVSEAPISGLIENEVRVNVDVHKMDGLKINFQDIENAIRGENVSMSGGEIKSIDGDNAYRRTLRIDGEFKDYKQLEGVIVKHENQEIVYLKDIATVDYGQVEATSYARLDGEQVLALDVKKKSGENLINAASKIRAIVEDAKENRFPKGLNVVITNDQSKFTINMVSNLENSIILGVILVVLVLMFFMGLRNAMFVGVAIPLSMLLGIAILNYSGTSLNMMVLFSLILALGMLVDNGIVVVENIYRLHTEEGKDLLTASKQGVGEVAIPIISSTATTVAAFLPLLFWKDLMGEFMKFLPITLIIVLSASVFVALVVNPVLTSRYLKKEIISQTPLRKFLIRNLVVLVLCILFYLAGANTLGGLFLFGLVFSILNRYVLMPFTKYFQNTMLPKLENAYYKTVNFALAKRRPIILFIATFFLMIGSIMFFGASNPTVLFFPDNEPRMVNIYIETPLGTDIEKTNAITKVVEAKVNKAIKKDSAIVEAVLAQVGEKTSDPNEGPQSGKSPNKARVTVSFLEYEKRVFLTKTSTSEVLENIRTALEDFPDASITISKDKMGPPVGKPINLEVKGENFIVLMKEVDKIMKKMEDANVPGVDKLKTDLELNRPELMIKIDRDAARRYGVSTGQIASTIRTALLGKEVSKYKLGEDDYPINVRLDDVYRYNLSSLLNLKITFRSPQGKLVQLPVSSVCDLEYANSFGTIRRLDMERVISIFSEVSEGYNANAIVGQLKQVLAGHEMPEGYEFKFTGEIEEQNNSSSFLMGALLLAVLLIFLIIVSQFNSIATPAIIMASVLFSTIGVFLGFGIFKMPFVILMCGIGIISLAGVVVNNAIVLIDYTNLLKKRKKDELGIGEEEDLPIEYVPEVIAMAGKTRLRPVLLTAITTVLGLFPMALGMNIDFFSLLSSFDPNYYTGGDNANFWGPMAWTIMFGLTFATFLTLVIVPVMVLLTDKMTYKVKKLAGKL